MGEERDQDYDSKPELDENGNCVFYAPPNLNRSSLYVGSGMLIFHPDGKYEIDWGLVESILANPVDSFQEGMAKCLSGLRSGDHNNRDGRMQELRLLVDKLQTEVVAKDQEIEELKQIISSWEDTY